MKNSRVKAAYEKKWPALQALLKSKGINPAYFDLYLRVFKHEGLLEIWVRSKEAKQFVLLKAATVCTTSGTLGPKRRQGDEQVPEGFYEIASFQPQSNYHLALKVSYPNKSDRLKTIAGDPGGDIMIHGNCVTIGCIPIQDEPIEELYVLSVEAKNHGSIIYADIYPFIFHEKTSRFMDASPDPEVSRFWKSLKTGYDYFELHKTLPKITVDKKGNYIIDTI
jgi:murein L,D-transpeptidase YafK